MKADHLENGMARRSFLKLSGLLGLGMASAAALPVVSADLKRALSDEEVKKNLGMMAIEAVYSTPDEVAGFIKAERKLWGDVIREAKISGNQ